MIFSRFIFFSIAFILSCQATAKAPLKGQMFGSIGLGTQVVQPAMADSLVQIVDSRQPLRFGLGLLAGVNSWLVADVSLSYGLSEFVRRSPSNQAISERSHRLRIPILMRYFPASFFSVGAGFYASYKVGATHGTPGLREDERTSASDTGEHGIELSLTLESPFSYEGYTFAIDGRGSYSLTPQDREARTWFVGYLWVRRSL